MNYPTSTKVSIVCFFIAAFFTASYADQLIYDNSNLTYYGFNPGTYIEFLDYGRSPGGKVCKFSFDYSTGGNSAGTIWVGFYRGTDYYDYGYKIKQFTLGAVPSADYIRQYEYVIPEDQQFDLPSGDFGYSFEFTRDTTFAAIASGGQDNENWIWVYYDFLDDFYRTYISGTWSGISMTVYAADPPDPNVCDISGYKFDDADGDGDWDAEENVLPGWNIFIDENTDGIYQDSEPNVVTDPNGFYIFEDLHAPATYTIRETAQDGWTQTLPGGPDYEYVIAIEPNNVYEGYNFGNTVSNAATVVLTAIEDTYIKEDAPDTNFGSATGVSCGLSASGARRAFVKFDLSSIPEGQVIVSATLQMDGSFLTYPTPLVGAYYASNVWDEMTATWNDPPTIYSDPVLDQTLVTIDLNTWDVTDKADTRYAHIGILSLALKTDELSETICGFYSKENLLGQEPPKLIIEYEPMFGGGKGTPDDPFQIWTAEQMNTIGLYSNRWDRHYRLMDDISMADYTGSDYNQIGVYVARYSLDNIEFRGVFDGNRYTISDFQSGALFGYLEVGMIKQLGLIAPNVNDRAALVNVGAFCNIAECWIDGGSVESLSDDVGALIGCLRFSNVAGCWSSADVSGGDNVGGLIGIAEGLAHIENCFAKGNVSGQNTVGGFIGNMSDSVTVHCYSVGEVSGTDILGGFCGYAENPYLPGDDVAVGCFWDTVSSQQSSSAVGTGLNTTEMQDQATFTATGWDFVGEIANGRNDDWAIPAGGGYPVLWYLLPTAPPLPSFAAGDGSLGNPYQIATVEQLNSIGHNTRLLDKHFQLANDLDLSGESFNIIADGPYAFTGSFDGNNHAIDNLNISVPYTHGNIGLIGLVYTGSVSDLTLRNVSVEADRVRNVGTVVGQNFSGTVQNCHSHNINVTGFWTVGGLVGLNYWHAYISGSSATGSVEESDILLTMSSGVGGIAGENSFWSEIETSGFVGDLAGDDFIGGLVGSNYVYTRLTDCYATGTINSTEGYIGGLVGRTIGTIEFTRCYAACEITFLEEDRVGAMAGYEQSGTYTGCFWDDQINGELPGFGYTRNTVLIDTAGETTANMQMASTYQAVGWDFNNVWDMRCEGMNYPRLQSQQMLLGDFVCPEGIEANDLVILIDEWLSETPELTADIAPVSYKDGIVNILDFAVFAENWMMGTD